MTHNGEDPPHPPVSMLAVCSRTSSRARCAFISHSLSPPKNPATLKFGMWGGGSGLVTSLGRMCVYFANTGIDSVTFIIPNWCAKLKRSSRQGSCGGFFDAVFFEASFILRPPAVGRPKSTLLCETYECTRANPASVVVGYPCSNETGSRYFARLQREKVAACLLLVAILRCQLNSPFNGEY